MVIASGSKYERTNPSRGSLIVDASRRYPGSYTNISAAIASLQNRTESQTIFIFPGTYTEQVYIPPQAGPLIIQGYTTNARLYKENEVTITGNLSRKTPGLANNDATATVRLWTSNVKFYNLNIANTFGAAATSGQALALSAQKSNQGFYGCNFTGWQDTIYANEGRQIYARSYINGAVDFIFGLRASVWFDKVDIESIGSGFITANGREAANNTSFYVFNHAKVTGTSGPNSTYLGRPWRPYSRVVFQRSYLGDVVKSEGWSRWDAVQSVENVFYKEYKNHGPGAAVRSRANFSSQLTAPIKVSEILGKRFEKEFWVDVDYLS
ncbi:carbohydrate esterase family 8 protein [Cucurbitaria berberidis CBS 394.84]|uniref:Pectinesterase n=1 Tax=Cucurbitaria berberidis CBS 394.84 TaxID=1168544 RepID=A0A9P4GRK5_9PLEO|nr:carbohydrate esterase family 8 protein [Cucurbitaria berberidis CBS 394.84]KAF1849806.1 carbohydrate esterase family 8 protein [Cucurbitaria berberidis CBS 394.84]